MKSYKVVLLGESGVGKSSLMLRFTRNHFAEYQESTIGAAFMTHTVELDDGQTVKYEIWDTAGQERYRSLAPMYYRGCSAGLVVFDVTRPDSYQLAKCWVDELRAKGTAGMVVALVANKTDVGAARRVDGDVAADYAQQEGLVYVETSAKADQGVTQLFTEVARRLLEVNPNPDREPEPARVDVASGSNTESFSFGQKCQCL